jgi:hypothetical protein
MLVRLSVSLLPFYHERFEMATSSVALVILIRCFLQSEALIQDGCVWIAWHLEMTNAGRNLQQRASTKN